MLNFLRNYKNKIITILIVAMLFCFALPIAASAEEGNPNIKFDNTNLLEELTSIPGFSFEDFNYDSAAISPYIFNIVEYCYSFNEDKRANYGVYLYIYNPQNIKFNVLANQNMITMAVAWDESGRATDFDKFKLQFVSKINSGQYANLFYKFKVVDKRSKVDNKRIVDRVNRDNRVYSISEFELLTQGGQNATSYGVGATYSFTGYAKGYGENPEQDSTLKWTVTNMETIEINGEDIGFSAYIMPYNNGTSLYHFDQVNSVYFSVPNKILNKYGNLQKVKFLTYGYDTAIMVTTENSILANELKNARNKSSDNVPVCVWNAYYNIKTITIGGGISGTVYSHNVDHSYNYRKHSKFANNKQLVFNGLDYSRLPYVFQKTFSEGDKRIDVSAKEVLDYIYAYNYSNDKGSIPHRNLTADLFTTKEPKYFGEPFEIDAGDLKNLAGYNMENGWNYIWNKLFGVKPKQQLKTMKPIEKVPNNYNLDDIYINAVDRAEFAEKMAISKAKNRSMHCFRFAVTDYYSELACYDYLDGRSKDDRGTGDVYFSRTSAFLDFDIIQLTFSENGKMTVIPVVMSPIDIAGNIQSPAEIDPIDWENIWDKILAVLKWVGIIFAVCLGLWLLAVLFPIIMAGIKIVCGVIALPFKAVGKLFKNGKSKATRVDKQSVSPKHKRGQKYSADEAKMAKDRFKPKKE